MKRKTVTELTKQLGKEMGLFVAHCATVAFRPNDTAGGRTYRLKPATRRGKAILNGAVVMATISAIAIVASPVTTVAIFPAVFACLVVGAAACRVSEAEETNDETK